MIEFNDNKPIYRQIVDFAINRILEGDWHPGEMIPSVRELSVEMSVNTRTVQKAFDELQTLDMIAARRGMGFMLLDDAADKARLTRRREFFDVFMPKLLDEMQALGIPAEEVTSIITKAANDGHI